MKKIEIKNNKKLLITLVLLMIFAILIPIGYALFSNAKQDETETHIGEIEVELVENWPELGDTVEVGENPDGTKITETYTESGITRNSKSVYGHSLKELDAYVRIRCIPIVEYFVPSEDSEKGGEWVTLPVSQSQIKINVDSNNNCWIQQGDYWYYNKVLKHDENTEVMNINWQVTEIPAAAYSYEVRTDVRVMLEYSQTTNDMWKENFQIENFPEGVELVK